MKELFRGGTRLLAAICALAFVCGCGGGGNGGVDEGGSPDATGSWSFVDPGGNRETVHLTQSGNQVSGNTDRGGTVSGTVKGTTYNIMIVYVNHYTINLNVTISGNTMTGTATDSNGGSGTVTATRPDDGDNDGGTDSMSVVGTWVGSLTGPGGSPTVRGTIVFNADMTFSVSTPLGGAQGTYTVSGNTVTMGGGLSDDGSSGTVVMQVNGQTMTIMSHYEGITGTLTKQ